MSTSTKGIISKGVTIEQILDYFKLNVDGNAEIVDSYGSLESFRIVYSESCGNRRMIHINYGYYSLHDNGIDGISLSLGCNNLGQKVMQDLVSHFGGYYLENDCDDSCEFIPINVDKFISDSTSISPKEQFKNDIIAKLGYNNLKATLELLESYKVKVIMPIVEESFDEEISSEIYPNFGSPYSVVTGEVRFLDKLNNLL